VTQQRQSSGAASERSDTGGLHSLDDGGSARLLRRRPGVTAVALTLGALTLGALGVGAMRINPARTTDAFDGLSAAWTHLLTVVHLRADPERAAGAAGPHPIVRPAPPSEPSPPPSGQSAIAYGDRLKVTFFESVGVVLGDPIRKPGDPAINAVFPRMDLSGEYVVDEAGGVDIPRLGWVTATGHSIGALEAQLADAFRRALGRPSDVHIAVLNHQPVYVLGGPRGGATIKYAPGMIALQALTEAGGYQRDASDTSRAIEAIRETQRLGEAKDRLARALVRQARLIDLRDGQSTITLPPATSARLAEMLPQDAIDTLLREANITLAMERQAHAERIALADRLVSIVKGELAQQNQRVTQARLLAQSKAARLRDLQGIAANGSVSKFKVADATIEVADAAARQEDLLVAVAQAESRVAEAEIARAKIVQAHTAQLALDFVTVGQELGDLDRTVASMRAVVAVLGNDPSEQTRAASGPPALRIVRQGRGGPIVIPATETTPLMPGDVLRIDLAEPATRPASTSAHP
jgi:exopolysaccharide production protein ExoF